MKNIPRVFIGDDVSSGDVVAISHDVSHYLTRVMRTRQCLVFGGGVEYHACLSDDSKTLIVGNATEHVDPSGDVVLMFSPIKRTDDLLNMATQMGVRAFLPVVMERTVAHHVNWSRMEKIIVESAEQSNRNSVPKILPMKKFSELDLSKIVFADERAAYGKQTCEIPNIVPAILIGPEGGFSDSEFAALDSAGACGVSLGKTILRAELASVVALARIMK